MSWMKKIAVVVGAIIGLSFVAAGLYWHFVLAPYYWVNMARHKNMQRLMWAAATFNTQYKRLPRDLSEMVKSGVLPEKGDVYFSPMKHHTLNEQEISYNDCEFDLSFSTNQTMVAIPKSTLADKTFSFVPEQEWSLSIGTGNTVMSSEELIKAFENHRPPPPPR